VADSIRLKTTGLRALAAAYGGEVRGLHSAQLGRFVPLEVAATGDLAPLTSARRVGEAASALGRGASLLVAADLEERLRAVRPTDATVWVHPHATWAMAKILTNDVEQALAQPRLGVDVTLGTNVTVGPRVIVGDRVMIGASSVIGGPGFGWALGPAGERVHVPQLGGVVIEDDVWVGPLVTVDAGTLGPTILRRGVKLDAHVHVGHNVDIGEDTVVAAQSGFAGSVKVGKRVLVGGQVGIADHVTVGDDARIAAKSGVIGDVPAGAVFAGYPAVERVKWLRGVASLYRGEEPQRRESRISEVPELPTVRLARRESPE
jgi:UDP-3-O-[3-hydroxymyristoyl] glucosamine N-acyltransferase